MEKTIIKYLNSKTVDDDPLFVDDIVYDNYNSNSYCTDKYIKVSDHITLHTHWDGKTLHGTTIWNNP